jgi:two-component system response regulator CpxR
LDDLELNTGNRCLKKAGKEVELTALEFNLLELLLRTAGRVVTREQVAKLVLGRQFSASDRSIDVHVSKLRRKLGQRIPGEDRIKAIRSVGYIYTVAQEDKK